MKPTPSSDLALAQQLRFDVVPAEPLLEAEPAETDHGAVFTKRWIVELILDLAGYTADKPLGELVALEPACGEGAFLIPMVERLSESLRVRGRPLSDATGSIRAYDLQARSVASSQRAIVETLTAAGWSGPDAAVFAAACVEQGDFLLKGHEFGTADFVLGNPPYVRLEGVPVARGEAYRRACPTMSGRADIYVGFLELGLKSLKRDGSLAFICADRWMRNQYGRLLRQLVGDYFSLEVAIEMHDVDAFAEEVSAYPSVVVIRRREQQTALVAETTSAFDPGDARSLADWSSRAGTGDEHGARGFRAAVLSSWFPGPASWPVGSPARLAALQELEDGLPLLEDEQTGTRVGIGVATGADRVFVTTDRDVAESERMLPLAMAADTVTGRLKWSGHYLANPWRNDGAGLIAPDEFPRLRAYYEENADKLRRRNVAKRRPKDWYRTIDRVDPGLTSQEKLLFPDIKATIHPVLDQGETYPHHNLYFVVSKSWDLEVLGGLLLSRVAQLFVEAYAVRMRGGCLRFQAQYLRRIRVPRLADITEAEAQQLRDAFRARDVEAATTCALRLYGLKELPA